VSIAKLPNIYLLFQLSKLSLMMARRLGNSWGEQGLQHQFPSAKLFKKYYNRIFDGNQLANTL
jgi:hypothetical protein